MKPSFCLTLLFFVFTINSFSQSKKESETLIGKTVSDFKLKNTDNKWLSLSDYDTAKGFIIVFTCNHCPFAKLYPQRLNELNEKYKSLGVPLIAINSMDSVAYEEETFLLMQEKSKRENANFPYLQDANQIVGKNFGAAYTPHTFIVWKENNNWVIKYSGAIDDNGEHPEKAHSFISKALNELLQNKKVSTPETKSFGCRIYYRKVI